MASPAGCEHYVRSCLLKAPCCGKLYVCRLCHDAEENHQMDRFKVMEVQCSACQTVQQAQQTCQQCHTQFGEYYCDVCHLFDKDKKQYHCQPCGICRIGPREKYFHCEKCNLCLAHVLQGNHKCVENVSRQNCPVCMEDIHTSRIGAQILPCGHLLHKTCFSDMVRGGAYRCPLCMHSAWNMDDHWDEMDEEIALSPMPTEYQGATVKIICNDCQAHCRVPFHVLGMKCSDCGSYNTAQDGELILQTQQQQPVQDTVNQVETEPEQQDQPPGQQDQPPGQQDQPPEQQDQPPEQQDQPPGQQDQPPGQQDQPPEQQDQPPGQQDQPPAQQDQPPEQQDQPPGQQDQPPEQQDQPPEQQDQPPGQQDQPQSPTSH